MAYFGSSERMNQLGNCSVDLPFTSPPYWRSKDYDHKDQIGRESYPEYIKRLGVVWAECYRVAKPDGVLVINIGSKRHLGTYHPIAMDIHANMSDWKMIDKYAWIIPNALPQPNHYTDKLPDNKHEDFWCTRRTTTMRTRSTSPRVRQKYRDAEPWKRKLHPDGRSLGNVFRIPAY